MPKLSDLLSGNSSKDKLAAIASENIRTKKRKQKPRPHQKPNSPYPVGEFISLDFETTGLDSKNDRVIEIGAVHFKNNKVESEYSTFVNPGCPVPPQISQLTGIVDKDVQDAPCFGDIADTLLEFIGNLPLCAHQVEFDISFLNESLTRLSRNKLKPWYLDTALISRVVLPNQPAYSLKFIAEYLKVELLDAHRALDDARASGRVAIRLLERIPEISLSAREKMAWFAPPSLFKRVLQDSCRTHGAHIKRRIPGLPKLPGKLVPEDELQQLSFDDVSNAFSAQGPLSQAFANYAERHSQIDMAWHVAKTLNAQSQLVAEAGPGIGKSFAYLIPAALYSVKNNRRIAIATHTRNLQDQLINKDLPVGRKVAGDDFRYAILKGRANYLCRRRFELLLSGKLGNLSRRERGAVLPLIRWAEDTTTGDIEEQNQFNRKWFAKIWNLISAESRDCLGRKCPSFGTCYLQHARQKALNSHVVVINHALFFSEVCSETSFLGKLDSLIFDEAHHVESVGHHQLRVEVDTNRFKLYTEIINTMLKRLEKQFADSETIKTAKKVNTHLKRIRKSAEALLKDLDKWAECRYPTHSSYQFSYTDAPFDTFSSRAGMEIVIDEMQDRLLNLKNAVGTVENNPACDETVTEIDYCSEQTSQIKADLIYVTQAVTEDHVFWIEGNRDKGWVKLCGVPLDIGSILKTVWDRIEGGLVFTSATLSISSSMEYLINKLGLTGDFSHTTEVKIFDSPFSSQQAIRGVITDAPELDSPNYIPFTARVIETFWERFQKNILCLFTSNAQLSSVYSALRTSTEIPSLKILAQRISGNRQTILEQFKSGSSMVLLGTDSFWEGIDAPGKACEIVIMCRLPFPVPSHPLTEALAKKHVELYGESFFSFMVPEAIIKFRQGAGRLIRSVTDHGALLVLDKRIVTKGYGKQFIRSVDGVFNSFDSIGNACSAVKYFFENEPEEGNYDNISYVPFDEA
ncbi:MAG: hypothetical protein GF401_11465 [Chitinivibrionales bacterium]|nr:hypothetical protein [Chitinivibrionales bacterium]